MFRRSKLSQALVVAFAGASAISSTAWAQSTPQRIEVTGSNIKRVDTETVAPVQIITREEIERTGQPTAAEVMRNLPINTGSYSEQFSNSFAPGAAGISLRGLGQKTTLVLLNGRRTAGYGFAQNLQDSFVDLNSLPSNAIDRIEILKDGASAIYGSDAIAGVVNIILRKDYKGFEANLSGGFYEGKGDYRLSVATGFGDLSKDKFNIFGTLDIYHRDLLMQADTEWLASRDFRNKAQGGRNFQSLTGGGTWRQLNASATAFTNNYRAISECAGTVMTGPQAVAAGLINPVGATNLATAAAANTFCTYDFNKQFTALPGTDRISGLIRATREFSPTTSGYAELGFSRVFTEQTFQAPFFAGTTGLENTAAGLRPFVYNITFNPGVSGNPYSTPARYNGVLNDMGTRDNEITSNTLRGVVGLNWVFKDWDVDSAMGVARNNVETFNLNRLTLNGVSAAFGVPTTRQPPTPFSSSASYNVDRFSLNSAATRDSIRANFPREATSELFFIDTRASTTFGKLPGGAVGLAVGAEFREERLKDRPDPLAQSGQILGQGITATDGKRSNTSVFAEVSLPLTKALEGQIAARADSYSDYGTSVNPKVGIKFKPTDSLLVRANWGKGFRAPTLPEISPSVATFFTSVIDPEDDTSRQISGVFAGNASLKAETSESATVGIVFEPTKSVNFGIGLYKIDWRNVVSSRSFQEIIDDSCPTGGPGCPSTANVLRDPTTNQIVTILSNYENLAQRVTSGIDIDGSVSFKALDGRITLRGDAIYVHSFKEDGFELVGTNGASQGTVPRVRAGLSMNYDTGKWSLTARANYTHSFEQQYAAASFFSPQDPRFQNGVLPARVASHTTVDLFGRYRFSDKISVSASILNAANRMPPFDIAWTNLTDIQLHDIRGRQFRISLKYSM